MDDLPVHTTPNHHPPKMDVLPKKFRQIILAATVYGQCGITAPNSSDDFCLLFCINPSSVMLTIWPYKFFKDSGANVVLK